MSLPNKFIVFLGRTFSGHNHDYIMLKQEFPPDLDWFTEINVRVDLGYLGMQSDYHGDRIDIPTKKPRKSHIPSNLVVGRCRDTPIAARRKDLQI